MTATDDLIGAFEIHSPPAILAALHAGADPRVPIRGKPPIRWLIEMYTRTSRFAKCLQAMLDAGATLDDPLLEAILLDDSGRLSNHLDSIPGELSRKIYLDGAYTCLQGVSALHLCAEYNSTGCLERLLELGADVDSRADVDSDGLGGQTPIFHAVNSNRNYCRPAMELLVDGGADLSVRVRGLAWGAGCDWETVLFDVTPISYAQCGLLPQFHRLERETYSNIDGLYRRQHGAPAPTRNVPNRYVSSSFDLAAARGGQSPEPD